MIKFGTDYSKLKQNLKLATTRLNLLHMKKLEQNERLKPEIGDNLKKKKFVQAKIKAQKFINEKASAEAMEIIKLHCEELLEKYELFAQRRHPDITLKSTIASLVWVAPHYQTQVPELQVVAKQLAIKYGPRFNKSALKNEEEVVDPELLKRVGLIIPSEEAIKKYLKKVCLKYGVTYENSKECVKNDFQEVKHSEVESSALSKQEETQDKLISDTEMLAENIFETEDKTMKNFTNFFKPKFSKSSKKKSEESIRSISNESTPASSSFEFAPLENKHIDQRNSSSTLEDNNDEGLNSNFSLENDINEINRAKNIFSDNFGEQYVDNDKSMRENTFIPTAPPSQIPVYPSIYYDPPPSYNSIYLKDNCTPNYCFDPEQLPLCPTEDPYSSISKEDENVEKRNSKKMDPSNF